MTIKFNEEYKEVYVITHGRRTNGFGIRQYILEACNSFMYLGVLNNKEFGDSIDTKQKISFYIFMFRRLSEIGDHKSNSKFLLTPTRNN